MQKKVDSSSSARKEVMSGDIGGPGKFAGWVVILTVICLVVLGLYLYFTLGTQ